LGPWWCQQGNNAMCLSHLQHPSILITLVFLSSCARMSSSGIVECETDCGTQARVCQTPTVMALARDLDDLEHHIERNGSIVTMQPSVWGQARLTRHRDEFERIMQQDLTTFKETLQGSLFRSDQAYLTQALALGVAISGP